jgi:hypothetical protein
LRRSRIRAITCELRDRENNLRATMKSSKRMWTATKLKKTYKVRTEMTIKTNLVLIARAAEDLA